MVAAGNPFVHNHTTPNGQPMPAPADPASTFAQLMAQPMRYNLVLEPQTDEAAEKIAKRCAKMHLAGCESEDDAYLRIMAGRAIGLPAMASVQSIVPIETEKNGKISVVLATYVKTKLALVLSRPEIIEFVRPVLLSRDKAIWEGRRVKNAEAGRDPESYEFTWDDAVIAGLVGRGTDEKGRKKMNNYDCHPKAMLGWRACGRLLDVIAGDILNGIASVEDVTEDRERGDAQPERGGAIPEVITKQVPERDWAAEVEVFKGELRAAVAARDAKKIKELRARFTLFQSDAPPAYGEDLQEFYLATKKEKRASGDAPTTSGPAPTAGAPAATSGAPTQGSLLAAAPPSVPACASCGKPCPNGVSTMAAGKSAVRHPDCPTPPATTSAPYVPPSQRGDSYEGPDTAEPPFG